MGSYCLTGTELSFLQDEESSVDKYGDGCTIMGMRLMPWNCVLQDS